MKVAFHLRKRPPTAPPAAVLIEAEGVGPLLDLVAEAGRHAPRAVFRVAGGYLVVLGPGGVSGPGSTRLRALAANLYLPVDAELVPALLDDEAGALARDRGLVFLPGGRVLGFDPEAPLTLSGLVEARRVEGAGWQPFPDRPPRAERVVEITLERPPGEDGLDPFGPATGASEAERGGPEAPDDPAGPSPTLADKAAAGAGKGLMGLGGMLGIKALADLGASWAARARERASEVTGAMLGRQEGALRELIRQFREGEVDRALRHALPLGGEGGRGGTPSGDGTLPEIDPTYSLGALFGQGKGPAGLWYGGPDIQAELASEYRKAAEAAERLGDYRRAAYIRGRLLNDFATAAMLLTKAGLHRDAALVHLNRLRDPRAAARSFEAAGEVDRALSLYRQERLHAEAGDLLRRAGEEAEALLEYGKAADLLASHPQGGPIAAGDLLRDRARRPDLALPHYAAGWARRPSPDAVACALRMATILADEGDVPPLLEVVDAADELLRHPGSAPLAVDFYNELARLADREALAEARDDLRDRALMGLAAKLREQVASPRRTGQLASTYFGRNRAWALDVVVDASEAIKGAVDLEAERRRLARMVLGPAPGNEPRRIKVDEGTVSAACHAPSTGEVFLGFESGRACRFGPASGVVHWLLEDGPPVASLAVDAEGKTLIALLGDGPGSRQLLHLERSTEGLGWSRQGRQVDGPGDFWLTPVLGDGSARGVGVWNGEEMLLLGGSGELSPWVRLPMSFLKTDPTAALLVPALDGQGPPIRAVLVHDGPDICQVEWLGKMVRRRYLGWRPTLAEGQTLRSAPLAWLQVEPGRFELAGLDREGVLHWSSLKVNEAELIRDTYNDSRGDASYAAATLLRAGLVAGVTRGRVDWLRCGPQSFADLGSTPLEAEAPLACFPALAIDELVVVCRDGTILCLPSPR